MADACGASQRGVRILADSLTVLGFLRKRGGEYELSPDAAAFLDQNSPAYLGGALGFLLSGDLRDCFLRLTDAASPNATRGTRHAFDTDAADTGVTGRDRISRN